MSSVNVPPAAFTAYNVDNAISPTLSGAQYGWGTNYLQIDGTITTQQTNADTETEAFRADVTLTQFAGVGIAGMSFNTSTAGALVNGVGGAWAEGIFASINEGTAASAVHATSGYITAGEFSTRMNGTWNAITAGVITLNAVDNRSAGTPFGNAFAYLLLRQYGTNNCVSLINMYDQAVVAGSSGHGGTLLESAADAAATHYIKISYSASNTSLWLMATTTAPS